MENKINIAELLKDCPKGMELYSPIFGKVYLDKIRPHLAIVVTTDKYKEEFLYDGRYGMNGECMLFPSKGKTTWEGFQRPFEDGDVIFTHANCLKVGLGNTWISIYKENRNGGVATYVDYAEDGSDYYSELDGDKAFLCMESDILRQRLATEEEKQKLFDAIKAKGYKWNEETKSLEKLKDTEDKGNISDGYHTFNELYEYRLLYNASMFNELAKQGLYDVHKSKLHSDGTIPFGDENWFIVQAELPTGQISNHYEMKYWDLFQVPIKEKANQYDGHTPQDVAKRLRDFLTLEKLPKFKAGDRIVKRNGISVPVLITSMGGNFYYYNTENSVEVLPFADQDDYEIVPCKFDITTLKPFKSEVLVRHNKDNKWCASFFSHIDVDLHSNCYKFVTIAGKSYPMMIPYEGNEHLLGTTNDCDEFYKNWQI